ncbi:MAG: YciI family protein [Steroidobacteraceae bacterium]
MLMLVVCKDAEDARQRREATMNDHLLHADGIAPKLRLAGRLVDEEGLRTVGSFLLVDVPDAAAARRLVQDDPYSRAGVWREVAYYPVELAESNRFDAEVK